MSCNLVQCNMQCNTCMTHVTFSNKRAGSFSNAVCVWSSTSGGFSRARSRFAQFSSGGPLSHTAGCEWCPLEWAKGALLVLRVVTARAGRAEKRTVGECPRNPEERAAQRVTESGTTLRLHWGFANKWTGRGKFCPYDGGLHLGYYLVAGVF